MESSLESSAPVKDNAEEKEINIHSIMGFGSKNVRRMQIVKLAKGQRNQFRLFRFQNFNGSSQTNEICAQTS